MNKLTKKSIVSSVSVGLVYIAALLLPNYFAIIIASMALIIVVNWKFFFDVDVKLAILREKAKFLILPLIFNLGLLYLTTIFFQTFAKVIITMIALIANYYIWLSLRKVHNLSDRAAVLHRNILILVSFVSVFLGSTVIFRLYMLLSTSTNRQFYQLLLVVMVFALFYSVSHFLTWENGAADDIIKLKPYNIINSLLGAEIAWVSSLWIVNYPVIAVHSKASLGGTPLPAILLAIVFYFLWGIIFHKLDRSLTRKVLTEYIFITIIFITVLLATARWLPTL